MVAAFPLCLCMQLGAHVEALKRDMRWRRIAIQPAPHAAFWVKQGVCVCVYFCLCFPI